MRYVAGLLFFVAVAAAWLWYIYGGGLEQSAANSLADIENQVAKDAETQYYITSRSGTKIDICVHAGFVAAAYLQAKDESNYQTWKATERRDCDAAGLPR